MQETTMGKVRKDETERDWEKYHDNSPTEGQKEYISSLARTVGLKVNPANIESRQKAARIIDQLKLASRRQNGRTFDQELRDRRMAFGMVTKLMFSRYRQQQKDPLKRKGFWKDVNTLFVTYLEHQEEAVRASR